MPPESAPPADPADPAATPAVRSLRRRLGDLLVESGAATPAQIEQALRSQHGLSARLGEILRHDGAVAPEALDRALAAQLDLPFRAALPPLDARARALGAAFPAADALAFQAVPVGREGGETVVATAAPERLAALRDAVPPALRPARIVVAPSEAVEARLAAIHGERMARAAERRVPQDQSARGRDWRRAGILLSALLVVAIAAAVLAPGRLVQVVTLLALAAMSVNLGLKVLALLAVAVPCRRPEAPPPSGAPLPVMSLLVPLHDEAEILPALVDRMARLDYPRALLDVLLVVEATDTATRAALARRRLPSWMRTVVVPDGRPRTKPRAMNYALGFARGAVVGVYDAEDAPDPDQLRIVARRFAAAPARTACLQGRLAFYNDRHNWIARCFAIEYATWFGLLLPGLARIGAVVPLGGTTLFFRREALEAVGAWDAHNVTEDADLGVRLARAGFRTEMVDTTTHEEANAAIRPWIGQRSRWIKGYVMTWAVHAARPVRLLRDLGPWRFLGFHALFGGAVLGALLLPVAWATVGLGFGMPHPVTRDLPPWAGPAIAAAMPVLLALELVVAWAACRAPDRRHLRPWAPAMQLYFPLGTAAALRALWEVAARPFHWEKTRHGLFGGRDAAP